MSRLRDVRGNATTATSADGVLLLDHTVEGYLGARADTRQRLADTLAADPGCVMAHCLEGYLFMLSSKRESVECAAGAIARAIEARGGRQIAQREELHLGALAAWASGDMRGALQRWDAILATHPRDIVALKVSQFVLSYLGESQRLRDTVERVLHAWDVHVPGYGFVLGCYAYGLEESGAYALAEATGRRAVELDPSDIWAAHAVAHVTEMQGRARDGIAWITSVAEQWAPCNNFANHLRWHEGLFHLDLEQHDHVLDLYDREVRRTPSDEYLDITNAVSLLWRLEQAGVDVGAPRWEELARCARGHVHDHALVFADLHYLMALAAVHDANSVERFLDSCTRFAAEQTTEASVMAEVGLPLARAVLAHRTGDYGVVVDLLAPVRHRFRTIGGSHAQRDVFDQLLIDAAIRGSRLEIASQLLAERTTRRPRNVWGWKHYAAVLQARGAANANAATRELERLRTEAGAT